MSTLACPSPVTRTVTTVAGGRARLRCVIRALAAEVFSVLGSARWTGRLGRGRGSAGRRWFESGDARAAVRCAEASCRSSSGEEVERAPSGTPSGPRPPTRLPGSAVRPWHTAGVGSARLLARPEDSVGWDTTANLLIEGENLRALELLRPSFDDRIKLAYLDPPYNLGGDVGLRRRPRAGAEWVAMMAPRLVARPSAARRRRRRLRLDRRPAGRPRCGCCATRSSAPHNFVATFTWETKRAARGRAAAQPADAQPRVRRLLRPRARATCASGASTATTATSSIPTATRAGRGARRA